MLFRPRNLLEKPSKLTIAIAAAGIGVAAAASATAVTLPGGATAGAATAAAYLHGAGVPPSGTVVPPADAMPRWAEELQANKLEMAQRAHRLVVAKARRAAAARRAARAAARRAARRAAHQAAVLAAQQQARQARKAHKTPSTAAPPQPSGSPQQIAMSMLGSYGWSASQFSCLDSLWSHESGWSVTAANPDGAYGIPQALPGSKMASAGSDWQTNAATQIRWGLGYIKGLYGSPCGAWSHEEATGSY
jgi:hypothetical protein